MTAPAIYEVGQRVWIYGRYRVAGPEVAGPEEGKVTKVGRTLVHVASGRYDTVEVYRMETGIINDPYGGSMIRSDEARDERDRQTAAGKTLNDAGITFTMRWKPNLELAEALAAVITAHKETT